VTEEHGVKHANPYFSDFLPDQDNKLAFQGYGYKSTVTFLKDVIALSKGSVRRQDVDPLRPSFSKGLISAAVTESVSQSLANDSRWIDL
jgi:hypothetical protein